MIVSQGISYVNNFCRKGAFLFWGSDREISFPPTRESSTSETMPDDQCVDARFRMTRQVTLNVKCAPPDRKICSNTTAMIYFLTGRNHIEHAHWTV